MECEALKKVAMGIKKKKDSLIKQCNFRMDMNAMDPVKICVKTGELKKKRRQNLTGWRI